MERRVRPRVSGSRCSPRSHGRPTARSREQRCPDGRGVPPIARLRAKTPTVCRTRWTGRCEELHEPDLPSGQIASCVHESYRPDVDADPMRSRGRALLRAGAAERLLLLGSATTRECQMGTCKKRPQRDRCPRRAQVQSPCRILFCRHTASAQTPCRRLRLLDECALRGCRCSPKRRRESATDSAICGGIGNEIARNNGFRHVSDSVLGEHAHDTTFRGTVPCASSKRSFRCWHADAQRLPAAARQVARQAGSSE